MNMQLLTADDLPEITYTLFGYARVSTDKQNLDRQLAKFDQLGIPEKNRYRDKQSGKNFERKNYLRLREKIRGPGDLIYIDSLSRLGRNYDGVIAEWNYFTKELGADVVILDMAAIFDSRLYRSDTGKLIEDIILRLLAYVADQERKKILATSAEGIAEARKKGVKFGRPKVEPDEKFLRYYKVWKDGGMSAADTWRVLGMTKATFYRRVKEYEEGAAQ